MKQYIEIATLCKNEEIAEIVTAFLSDYPFESFDTEYSDDGLTLKAYILVSEWEQCENDVLEIIAQYGKLLSQNIIEDENWNAQWEAEGFQRVEIDDIMVIRAPHHSPAPAGTIDIVVAPQMSFGSGHHQTTRMMCRLIHSINPSGSILDVGCGTGVLSIAALKCGATKADAIDIDIWSVESAREAAQLNNVVEQLNVIHGTIETIEGLTYDMVVANINRNIIFNDISRYVAALNSGGHLLLSGFLQEDIDDITCAATSLGLTPKRALSDEGWHALSFTK